VQGTGSRHWVQSLKKRKREKKEERKEGKKEGGKRKNSKKLWDLLIIKTINIFLDVRY
jgi:hypothetical protein